MNIKELYKTILKIVPEAMTISKQSPQGGIYLVFEGVKSISWQKDRANFRLIFASRSLVDDNFSGLNKLEELRERFIKEAGYFSADLVVGVEFDGFEDSLFKYSILLEATFYRDIVEQNLTDSDESFKDKEI